MHELRSGLMKGPWRQASAGVAGLVGVLLFAVTSLGAYDALRERTFDGMLARLSAQPDSGRVVVVDIDRLSLERHGPWPWNREQIAALISEVAKPKPAAIGLDILIEGPDERSPAALARRLAELTGAEAVRLLARDLVDGDQRLADAIRGNNVVAGLVLDPERPSALPSPAPVLVQGGSDLSGIWQATGASGPPRLVAESAAGLGVLALAGDADGLVRRVPLLTIANGQIRPGLALELMRVTTGVSAYVVAHGNVLRVGQQILPLSPDAALRLIAPSDVIMQQRRVRASELGSAQAAQRLAGRVVLIGSSEPELGGLRPGSGGALYPSVQLQAAASEQLLTGQFPRRAAGIDGWEIATVVVVSLAALLAGLLLAPQRAVIAAAAVALGWLGLSIVALSRWQWLIDPIGVPMTALSVIALTTLLTIAHTRRREAALRQRFAQHLAPELVERLVENPELLKLAGETREVTILFTDVEGFTAMTERSDPTTLIRVLDRYIDEMSAIIVAHGGMVEKIVGDGFHGLFNAPLDLDAHADKAVACARAIRAFSESFAAEDEPASLGFGRTRVGVETGPVIVSDVGGGTRLDYTAYGNAMNTAARLEALNKELGSAICIGPNTAAALTDKLQLRPMGLVNVRGRSAAMAVYDIWPDDMDAAARKRFADALKDALQNTQNAPAAALQILKNMARARPHDVVMSGIVERLSDTK